MSCIYCGREINNPGSLASHQMRCEQNPDRVKHKTSRGMTGRDPWNKGLTKDTSAILAEISRKNSISLSGHPGVRHSDKTKKRLREVALERGLGGYQEKSGRGKKGRYKGIWCDSSWELAFVIYCLDNGKCIKRCKERRKYIFEGEEKIYIPDFVVDGSIVEIKGYRTAQWESKEKYNPDVKVYGKEEMSIILSWVKCRYGKNFTQLYEEAQAD